MNLKKEIEKANYVDKFKPLGGLESFNLDCRPKFEGMLNKYFYNLVNKNEKIDAKAWNFLEFLNKMKELLFNAQHKLVLKETLFSMLAEFDEKILYADMSAVAYCVLF